MTNWLSKTVSSGKTAFNIVKSIGPFLISQSEIVSDSYVKHQAKLASVEIGKELIIDEAKTLNDVRKQLLTKFTESNAEDRIRIKKDIEYIEGNLRQLNIGQKALSYLPPPKDKKTEDQTSPEIIPHWMDKFNELARVRNEPWREELLARALATEASSPGTVMPRALWLIGTLEEHLFHAFASLLDIAANVGEGLMIPEVSDDIANKPIPNCSLGEEIEIGTLAYMLEDIGVLADSLSTKRTFRKGTKFIAMYFEHVYLIECKEQNLIVGGYIPTGIGTSIASFYEQKFNELGKEIFLKWIEGLDKSKLNITNIAEQGAAH